MNYTDTKREIRRLYGKRYRLKKKLAELKARRDREIRFREKTIEEIGETIKKLREELQNLG